MKGMWGDEDGEGDEGDEGDEAMGAMGQQDWREAYDTQLGRSDSDEHVSGHHGRHCAEQAGKGVGV